MEEAQEYLFWAEHKGDPLDYSWRGAASYFRNWVTKKPVEEGLVPRINYRVNALKELKFEFFPGSRGLELYLLKGDKGEIIKEEFGMYMPVLSACGDTNPSFEEEHQKVPLKEEVVLKRVNLDLTHINLGWNWYPPHRCVLTKSDLEQMKEDRIEQVLKGRYLTIRTDATMEYVLEFQSREGNKNFIGIVSKSGVRKIEEILPVVAYVDNLE